MPTLKRSKTCRRKYGGNRGMSQLRQAIEFYFKINSVGFEKEFPSFTTPTVDMFFTYASGWNSNLIAIAKDQKIKKFGTNNLMETFLWYLYPFTSLEERSFESCLKCFNVLFDSLFIYNYVTTYFEIYIETKQTSCEIQHIIEKTFTSELYDLPLHWFFSNIMTIFNDSKCKIITYMSNYMKSILEKLICPDFKRTPIEFAISLQKIIEKTQNKLISRKQYRLQLIELFIKKVNRDE